MPCGALRCPTAPCAPPVPCGVPAAESTPWCPVVCPVVPRGVLEENRKIGESENQRIRGYENTRIRECENVVCPPLRSLLRGACGALRSAPDNRETTRGDNRETIRGGLNNLPLIIMLLYLLKGPLGS